MAALTKDDLLTIRTIIREETGPKFTKLERGLQRHTVMLKDLDQEVQRNAVLLEDLDHKFDTALEALTSNLTIKDQVDDHEERLRDTEATQRLLTKLITVHSRQLNSMTRANR